MAIQILGADGSTTQQLDSTFQASRVTLRPCQVTSYVSVGAQTGLITTVAANGAIFSLRNLSSNLLLVRRVGVKFVCTTAFTTAQRVDYGLMAARAFTASDTGGTAIALTGNNCKVRTSLGTLTSVDCRIATTGALTAGTKTLDTNTVAQDSGWIGAIGASFGAADNLLSQASGDYPVVLAQNEGFNIMNLTLMGATGVGIAYVNLEIAEAVSY